MTDNRYRQIFKATSIFGIVQISNVLITIVRGKVLSMLLGASGMGLNGLLLATTTLVKNMTSLGLPESSVKQIAIANTSSDKSQIGLSLSVMHRWMWVTVFLGALVMILFSPLLSKLTLGTYSDWRSFVWLSVSTILGALTAATHSLMRGMQQLRYLALSSVLGSLLSLIAGIPFIFMYGIDGVVPSIIASSFATYFLSRYFSNKLKVKTVTVSWGRAFQEGKEMIKLGIVLSITALMGAATNFLLPAFIVSSGALKDAGLYSAGLSLTTGYVGMVFSAMITDYFPRLSAAVHTNSDWKRLVSQQAELVLLILSPILVLLVVLSPVVIRILLTPEFLEVMIFIPWAALGLFIQGIAWSLGAILVAKGDLKVKLTIESIDQVAFLVFSLAGYKLAGLQGLGIGFLVSKMTGLLLVSAVVIKRHQFGFTRDAQKLSLVTLAGCLAASGCAIYFGFPGTYYSGAMIFVAAAGYSIYQLNERLDIMDLVRGISKKFGRHESN